VTLTWTTVDAEEAELDGQSVIPDGTQEVTPASSTTYTLVARNTKTPKTDTKSCEVTVNASPQAVTIGSFKAVPESIELGQSARLSWEVKNPTTLDLDGQRIAPRGTLELEPTETTSYKLTANGHDGPTSAEVTITVKAIDKGLLPDKGGFVCGLTGGVGPGLLPPLLLLAVALLLASRLAHRRRNF